MNKIKYILFFFFLLNATYSSAATITPNGKTVAGAGGHSELSPTAILAINYIVENYYDVEVLQSSQSDHGLFNCHFFAWHNNQGYGKWDQDYIWKNGTPSELIWDDYPTDYYTDGAYSVPSGYASYVSTASSDAEICVYTYSGTIKHSARMIQNSNKVISKWGLYGIYKHDPYECPDGRWVWSPWTGSLYHSPYGTITAYYKINPNFRPVDDPGNRFSTIYDAINGAPSGSCMSVYPGTHYISSNVTFLANNIIQSGATVYIQSGKTVNIESSTTLDFGSSARLYSYGNLIINNNATLNLANIMVYSSGSMTVKQGVAFNMAGGDYIYSFGQLQVQGTYSNKVRFQSSGSWYGLTLIGPSTGTSYINYAIVSGSTYGIRVIGTPFFHMTYVTTENHSDYGLRVYGTEPTDDTWFTICKFNNNNGHGVEVEDGYAYFGWANDFEWNGENGINMKNYGVVTFGEEEEEAEAEIKSNDDFGIRMHNNCSALIGDYSDEFGGYNEIYGNDDYDVYLSGSSQLYAELTWWGSNPPDPDNFLINDGCFFDYDPYETSPPLGKRIPSSTLHADTPARFLMYIWELARQDSTEGYTQTQEAVRAARNHPDPRIARLATRLYMRTLINNGKVGEGIAIGEQLLGEDDLDDENRAIVAKQLFYAYLLELKYTKQAEDMFNLLAQLGDEEAENGLLAIDFEHATGQAPLVAPPQTAASKVDDNLSLEGYPNPFNPTATIRFGLPEEGHVTMKVYDVLGREVATLVDGYLEPGYHQFVWNGKTADGREVPSGLYIARLVTPATARSIKLVLLR